MNHPTDTIEIALQSDKRFFPGLLATACSIAEHVSATSSICFRVLDGGIEESQKKQLEALTTSLHPDSRFVYLPVDLSPFAKLPAWRGCGRINWARLLLPSLLPTIDWIIYLDVDFLCLGDISELWALRNDHYALLCAIDTWPYSEDIENNWFRANGKTFNSHTYFCSGLLVLNLARFRSENLLDKVDALLQCDDVLPAGDQSVLNVLFADRSDIKFLPPRWQRFSREINDADFDDNPFIHFAGEAPWVCVRANKILNEASLFWFRYYAHITKSSLFSAIIQFYRFHEIFVYRILYLLLSKLAPAHWCFNFAMKVIGHNASIPIYNAFLHNVRFPKTIAKSNHKQH